MRDNDLCWLMVFLQIIRWFVASFK